MISRSITAFINCGASRKIKSSLTLTPCMPPCASGPIPSLMRLSLGQLPRLETLLLPSYRSFTVCFLGPSFQPRLAVLRRTCRNYSTSIPSLISGPRRRKLSYSPPCIRPSCAQSCANHPLELQSNIISVGAAFTFFAVATLAFSVYLACTFDDQEDVPQGTLALSSMSYTSAPGHVGNLTPDQEEKLRKLWLSIFHICGLIENNDTIPIETQVLPDKQAVDELDAQKKKRFNVFRRKGNDKAVVSIDQSEDDKYGHAKNFQEMLANHKPETIREAIWDMVKHDHPDALALRFLRARQWDVGKALIMMISTMVWRHNEMKVDSDIMRNGEGGAVADEQGANGEARKVVGHDFMSQIRTGKSFLHGVDKQGRPLCIVRVRHHKQGEETEESIERCVVYVIETARLMLTPPVDTATVIFDMTGFSMANMDYTGLKFVIKCFEANYPESLGAVLVHRAPWIFQGIWKMIRGWLDPVVAAKVHFTNTKSELETFIEPDRILKELGGDENWDYQYQEPIIGENDVMKDTETRDCLLQLRQGLIKEFETATLQWIQASEDGSRQKVQEQRTSLASKLREDYWRLDPYIRARSLYDRQGVLRGGAQICWYPSAGVETITKNGVAARETSTDDVD